MGGSSALLYASNNGNTGCVEALLDHGAKTEYEDNNGYTALIAAVHNLHSDTAELLISRGAALGPSSKGLSALYIACKRGSIEMVQILLRHGADAHFRYQDRSLLSVVKSRNGRDKEKIIQLLRQYSVAEY